LAFSVWFYIYYTGAIKEIRGFSDLEEGKNLILAQEYYGRCQGARGAFFRSGADFGWE
jgi:hypothetical protein